MFGRLKPGDTITVNTSDSREVKGCFEAGRAERTDSAGGRS